MYALLNSVLFMVVGFGLLTWGAGWLVRGASSIAKHFRISDMAIGMTVVAIGTSAPELFVNLVAGISQHDEMVFGNVIGSNIFNIFMILGSIGVFRRISIRKKNVMRELPYSILAFCVVFVLINDRLFFDEDTNLLSRQDALIILFLYIVFLIYVLTALRKLPEEVTEEPIITISIARSWGYVAGGMLALGFGGHFIVEEAKFLTEYFHVTAKLVSLTLVAVGTSLPELAASISAARHQKIDIAVGNVIGSNILNIMLILPIGSLFHTLHYNSQMNFDFNIMIIGTILFFTSILTSRAKKLSKWEAVFFVVLYMAYTYFLLIRG